MTYQNQPNEELVDDQLKDAPGLPQVDEVRVSLENEDVRAFHRKFGIPMPNNPSFLNDHSFDFRVKFMQEELNEFILSHREGNMHDAADALVDLAYVIHGTASMMGIPWVDIWNEVHEANMSKVRAVSPNQSKRGSALDVIKPEGWVGPDHTKALGSGPWPCAHHGSVRSETASEWIREVDESFLVCDVYDEFIRQPFCDGLSGKETQALFSHAMNEYAGWNSR